MAGERDSSVGTIVRVTPEGPSPPARSQQSCGIIAEVSLRSFQSSAMLCHNLKAQVQPVWYVAQSPKLAPRSGNGVDVSKWRCEQLVSGDVNLISPSGVLHRHSRST